MSINKDKTCRIISSVSKNKKELLDWICTNNTYLSQSMLINKAIDQMIGLSVSESRKLDESKEFLDDIKNKLSNGEIKL